MAWALETQNLTRRFGGQLAVNGIGLQVPGACICGFLGPNGAGKTTTLRLVLGLLRADSGSIAINGVETNHARPESRLSLGALIESPSLYPHLSGRENLEVVRRLRQTPPAETAGLLTMVRLDDQADKLVRHYSLGMRQRLALALAMVGSPSLLILDEPANGLDPAGVVELRDRLRHLVTARGATVLLSSHMLLEVEQVADHVAIIAQGTLRFQGSLSDFRARQGRNLQIGVDRIESAVALLQARGWQSARAAYGMLSVAVTGDGDAATINALLVGHGLAVHRLAEDRPALEALFLQSIEAVPA